MTNTDHEKHILNLLVKDMFCFVLLFFLFTVAPSFLIAQQDTLSPVLNGFSLSHTEIVVTIGGHYVEVTISVEDDLSGLNDLTVLFKSPSGSDWKGAHFSDWTPGAMSYTSTGRLIIQQCSESGEWELFLKRTHKLRGLLQQ